MNNQNKQTQTTEVTTTTTKEKHQKLLSCISKTEEILNGTTPVSFIHGVNPNFVYAMAEYGGILALVKDGKVFASATAPVKGNSPNYEHLNPDEFKTLLGDLEGVTGDGVIWLHPAKIGDLTVCCGTFFEGPPKTTLSTEGDSEVVYVGIISKATTGFDSAQVGQSCKLSYKKIAKEGHLIVYDPTNTTSGGSPRREGSICVLTKCDSTSLSEEAKQSLHGFGCKIKSLDSVNKTVEVILDGTISTSATSNAFEEIAEKMFWRGVGSYADCLARVDLIADKLGEKSRKSPKLKLITRVCASVSPSYRGVMQELLSPSYEGFDILRDTMLRITREGESKCNVNLMGPKGSGKNVCVRTIGALLNKRIINVSCHGDTTTAELISSVELEATENGSVTKVQLSDMLEGIISGHTIICIDEWNALASSVSIALHSLLEESDRRIYVNKKGVVALPESVALIGTSNDNSLGDYAGVSASPNVATFSRFSTLHVDVILDVRKLMSASGITLPDDTLNFLQAFWTNINERVHPINDIAIPLDEKYFCPRALKRAVNAYIEDCEDIKVAVFKEFYGMCFLAEGDMKSEIQGLIDLSC